MLFGDGRKAEIVCGYLVVGLGLCPRPGQPIPRPLVRVKISIEFVPLIVVISVPTGHSENLKSRPTGVNNGPERGAACRTGGGVQTPQLPFFRSLDAP